MGSLDNTISVPLFDWKPPCRVIPFPAQRRVGKIRRVAEVLDRKQGRDADVYWQRTVSTMAEQMAAAGVSTPEAVREMSSFFAAVQLELDRLAREQPYTHAKIEGST